MNNVPRIDIRKVNANGRYVDLSTSTIIDLTDEQILALRKYYNDPSIAMNRRLKSEYSKDRPRESSASRHQENRHRRPNYRLTKDQKYNRGHHRTKHTPSRLGPFLIVGSIVVCLAFSGKLLGTGQAQASEEIEASIHHYSSNVIIEEVASLDGLTVEDLMNSTSAEVIMDSPSNDLSAPEEMTSEAPTTPNYSERELLIQDICNIYQVNYDIVYPKLVELTNNFSSPDYLNGIIRGVTCKGVQVEAKSEEELLVYAIRCIKQLPDTLGVESTNLYINNGYTSDTDYNNQLSRVGSVLGLDRCLLYAIVQSESGFNSNLFNDSNNPAGIKAPDGTWWVFSTKEEGFFELGMEILKYYRRIGVTPDHLDYETLSKIRDIHAPLVDNNDTWLPNVTDNLAYAKLNEAELFNNLEQSNGLSR